MLKKILSPSRSSLPSSSSSVRFNPTPIGSSARSPSPRRADLFAQVNDLRKTQAWSPWMKLDPNAKYTFEGRPPGSAQQRVSGNSDVGEGRQTIIESKPNELVGQNSSFSSDGERGDR